MGVRKSPEYQGRVLTIAGSDSGGGAGIQADIKTISALGGYAMTAITALTAQNTIGIEDIIEIDPDFVALQARMCLEDIGADAIKIGMMPTENVIRKICALLDECAAEVPVVVDPVMSATTGRALSDETSFKTLRDVLLKRCAVITPNVPEAERLSGLVITDVEGMMAAGEAICDMGARAAFITGGHLEGTEIHDVLIGNGISDVLSAVRLETGNTHGTGCTLASALATELAFGTPLPEAAEKARDFVRAAISNAAGLGNGNGPLNHQFNIKRL